MPLVTSQGYQLMPDTLGAIKKGFALGDDLRSTFDKSKKERTLKGLREKALKVEGNPELSSIVDSPNAQKETEALAGLGLDTPEKKQSAKAFTDRGLAASDEELPQIINERVGEIVTRGGDPRDTAQLLNLPPAEARQEMQLAGMVIDRDAIREMYIVDPSAAASFLNNLKAGNQEKAAARGQGASQQKSLEQTAHDDYVRIAQDPNSTPFEVKAAEIKLKMRAAVGSSKDERVAGNKQLSTDIASYKAEVKAAEEGAKLKTQTELAPNLEKQKLLAKDAGALSTAMFKQMGGIEKNISNLEEGIRLIDAGAATGPIDKWFPSFKESTVALDNLKSRLGIDVIGSVTFGALSEGELKLAMDTAVPSNLKPEALKKWFQERIEPQKKLLAALEDAGIYLAEEGATIPKLMARRRKEKNASKKTVNWGDL